MLSIQCDDNTAAAIIVDDVTEISMTEEDWEISGRPTIGDTISFDVTGGGAFVDAFNGLHYLVTDEYQRGGDSHIISFIEVSHDTDMSWDGAWFSYETVDDDAMEQDEPSYGEDGIDVLKSFPGIIAPDQTPDDERPDDRRQDDRQKRQISIKNMPSMTLIGALMHDHGMSMHDIVAGLIAMENETTSPIVNEDVIVDFFQQNSDDIKSISEDFEAYSSHISNGPTNETEPRIAQVAKA